MLVGCRSKKQQPARPGVANSPGRPAATAQYGAHTHPQTDAILSVLLMLLLYMIETLSSLSCYYSCVFSICLLTVVLLGCVTSRPVIG